MQESDGKNAVYKSASKIVGSSTFESYTHKFRCFFLYHRVQVEQVSKQERAGFAVGLL